MHVDVAPGPGMFSVFLLVTLCHGIDIDLPIDCSGHPLLDAGKSLEEVEYQALVRPTEGKCQWKR